MRDEWPKKSEVVSRLKVSTRELDIKPQPMTSTAAVKSGIEGCTLKDLCAADKQKVANLIKQVVDLGQANEALANANEQEVRKWEEKVKDLQNCNREVTKEHTALKAKLSQMVVILRTYQHKVQLMGSLIKSMQQEKLTRHEALASQEPSDQNAEGAGSVTGRQVVNQNPQAITLPARKGPPGGCHPLTLTEEPADDMSSYNELPCNAALADASMSDGVVQQQAVPIVAPLPAAGVHQGNTQQEKSSSSINLELPAQSQQLSPSLLLVPTSVDDGRPSTRGQDKFGMIHAPTGTPAVDTDNTMSAPGTSEPHTTTCNRSPTQEASDLPAQKVRESAGPAQSHEVMAASSTDAGQAGYEEGVSCESYDDINRLLLWQVQQGYLTLQQMEEARDKMVQQRRSKAIEAKVEKKTPEDQTGASSQHLAPVEHTAEVCRGFSSSNPELRSEEPQTITTPSTPTSIPSPIAHGPVDHEMSDTNDDLTDTMSVIASELTVDSETVSRPVASPARRAAGRSGHSIKEKRPALSTCVLQSPSASPTTKNLTSLVHVLDNIANFQPWNASGVLPYEAPGPSSVIPPVKSFRVGSSLPCSMDPSAQQQHGVFSCSSAKGSAGLSSSHQGSEGANSSYYGSEGGYSNSSSIAEEENTKVGVLSVRDGQNPCDVAVRAHRASRLQTLGKRLALSCDRPPLVPLATNLHHGPDNHKRERLPVQGNEGRLRRMTEHHPHLHSHANTSTCRDHRDSYFCTSTEYGLHGGRGPFIRTEAGGQMLGVDLHAGNDTEEPSLGPWISRRKDDLEVAGALVPTGAPSQTGNLDGEHGQSNVSRPAWYHDVVGGDEGGAGPWHDRKTSAIAHFDESLMDLLVQLEQPEVVQHLGVCKGWSKAGEPQSVIIDKGAPRQMQMSAVSAPQTSTNRGTKSSRTRPGSDRPHPGDKKQPPSVKTRHDVYAEDDLVSVILRQEGW